MLKKFDTIKLFYDEYPYKLVVRNSLSHIFRDKNLPNAKQEIDKLQDSLLATGFPYFEFEEMESYLAVLNSFMKETDGLRRLGSAAVDLVYTACGRFDGFFEYNLHAWDVAGGICIVREAGGRVTDFKNGGDPLFGKQIVATNGATHEAILKTINAHFK